MDEWQRKPRVFLSHSKLDSAFVQRVCEDLRNCQIDPWLDSVDIRHGEPWLDAIFRSGIPACDCVLVYLSHNSLESALVRKEIDASLIAKLRDRHVLFLPYVSDSNLRAKLRSDIQALQTPEWNDGNYGSLLPRVVSEVWRGFMERCINAATDAEKVKRLEAEREVDRLRGKKGGVFDHGEDMDFRYIWDSLKRLDPFTVEKIEIKKGEHGTLERLSLSVCVRSIVPFLGGPHHFEHHLTSVADVLRERLKPVLLLSARQDHEMGIKVTSCPDLSDELMTFGLIERRDRPQSAGGQSRVPAGIYWPISPPYICVYAPKLERFKYWLAFNGILPQEIEWSVHQPAGDEAEDGGSARPPRPRGPGLPTAKADESA